VNVLRKHAGVTVVVVSLLGVGAALSGALLAGQAAQAAIPPDAATALSDAFANAAEVIRPSVVSVSSVKRVQASRRLQRAPGPMSNNPLREFFGDDFLDRFLQPEEPGRGYAQQGLGTGVIVSDDGYIVTNNHVVREADEVSVKLPDDRSFKAKVVGTDEKTDLAVIKIEASGLHAAKLGDSDALKIGEWVVAAGNPFGLSSTITAGIVSAKGRSNVGIADYEDFIQTDAAINPGNSGGPLVNLRGEVVGINTAIFSRSGGYMGIGFAIPVNMVRTIKESLISKGRVVRGLLGAAIQNLNEGLAKSFSFPGTEGVLIGDVAPGGPADQAGLQAGDVITEFDGKKAVNVQKLRAQVAQTDPGTDVPVEAFREGQRKQFKVRIGELDAGTASAGEKAAPESLGMNLENVTPEIAQQLGYDTKLRGVVVTEVEPLSPADRAGLQVRDVIVAVQDQPVEDVAQFRTALGKHKLTEGIRLAVKNGTMRRYVFLQAGE